VNKRVIQSGDFTVALGNVHSLTPEGRKKFLLQYEERKQTEIQHPIFGILPVSLVDFRHSPLFSASLW
jgi:CRISPR-associated protein Cas1